MGAKKEDNWFAFSISKFFMFYNFSYKLFFNRFLPSGGYFVSSDGGGDTQNKPFI